MSNTLSFDRCLIIGEVAQAHDGSLGMAHAYIDSIADAGADAVKFQTHLAHAESTPREPWRIRFSKQDVTRYEYWKRMEFTEAQWHGLREHASQRGILFLSSPFSFEAVELLTRVGVAGWKVASGEVNNAPLLDAMLDTGLPMILSSGMSPWTEIDKAVERVNARNLPLALLQCTTAYPCPAEKIGLNLLSEFRERYGCDVGLSDHSGTIYPGLAAVTLGAKVLEVHVTFSREMFGPDVPASLTTGQLRQLVEGTRFIETSLASPIDKDAAASGLSELRGMFTKSIVARESLDVGTVIEERHLAFKKPGDGMAPERVAEILGRKLKNAVAVDDAFRENDFE